MRISKRLMKIFSDHSITSKWRHKDVKYGQILRFSQNFTFLAEWSPGFLSNSIKFRPILLEIWWGIQKWQYKRFLSNISGKFDVFVLDE